MKKILHISDTHFQNEVMRRLTHLAWAMEECDVVAVTGDCTCNGASEVPASWDSWPQRKKFAVPGNHDRTETFVNLKSWCTATPYLQHIDDLLFIGLPLDGAPGDWAVARTFEKVAWDEVNGIVLLSHCRKTWARGPFLDEMKSRLGDRELLLLHGDEHPRWFTGLAWEREEEFGLIYTRSNVCSSARERGLAHLITWDGKFSCERVRGEDAPIHA